ncbi:MAG: alpha-glucan family phosphorylase, partial [Candidatus Riflebacteria bacterium]|nr:alpha-glucan family phosphorylase [Candidatus Riflebacteria bacterium]
METFHAKLKHLAANLWWTWHPEVIELFRALDPERWRLANHNPEAFLRTLSVDEVESRTMELDMGGRINFAVRRLGELLKLEGTWGWNESMTLMRHPVAYFSAEFGIHESLPIYSGGLGVLAGDHLKTASNLGVPLVGVGLLYAQGYFRQRLDANGWQREEYGDTDLELLPLHRATDAQGNPVVIEIDMHPRPLFAAVWKADVGRATLLLLDADVEGNSDEDRTLTTRLYGGDQRMRIRQELILGIGGMMALGKVGIRPGVLHLNEGHSAFAPLGWVRQQVEEEGLHFSDAIRDAATHTVFTTHTPVEAGHDRFGPDLIWENLGWLAERIGMSGDQLLSLGRVNPNDPHEPFTMTVLALKLSRHANAVSALHGHVSRKMWNRLWPDRRETDVPIGHVTNGVHVASWLSPTMYRVYERYLGKDWDANIGSREAWAGLEKMPEDELWEAHTLMRHRMIDFVRRRLENQARLRGEDPASGGQLLDKNTLTIGFARRFATYKRATLLFSDLRRLTKLLGDAKRPVQIIMAGKAHPQDEGGKRLIQEIVAFSREPKFRGRLVFVEDYDIGVGRHLVQGVDVWLNNPQRPLEACGTSGQKVVLNGGLNLSVLDGWWAEAFDGTNGFAIGDGHVHVDPGVQARRDAASLYEVLEKEVVPLFYDRDAAGLPSGWMRRMKRGILTLAWRFSSARMLMDYVRKAYLPASGSISCQMGGASFPSSEGSPPAG